MPRPLKFPGLQPKFESALQSILANAALSGWDILRAVETRASDFNIAADELADLLKNFANYIARAKEADVIRSGGPWAGYQLVRVSPGISDQPRVDTQQRRPNEAAMHFVATCGLSINFGSKLVSLPTTVDPISWGNADMLMLRGNPSRQRIDDLKLDPEVLKIADSSPECILSSIELKYDLERNRRLWFQAVAEAAANSRWANESLLVHVTPEGQRPALDDEVVSLARTAEIGILEISAAQNDGRYSLETNVLVAPSRRPLLRLAELSSSRDGLLQEAHKLLSSWKQNDVVTYLDEDGAPSKLLRLLMQAIENLKRQASFGTKPLAKSLYALAGQARVGNLFSAALDATATSTGTASSLKEAQSKLEAIGKAGVPVNQWTQFETDLTALQKFSENSHGAGTSPRKA
jgi:hypothetical protein